MSAKSLFEIALPIRDNDGAIIPEGKHFAFENYLVEIAGGYTRMPATDGAWLDDDGKLYLDRMFAYRVACEPDVMRALIMKAFAIYGDQKAIMVSEIGRAWIVPRAGLNQAYRYTRLMGDLSRERAQG